MKSHKSLTPLAVGLVLIFQSGPCWAQDGGDGGAGYNHQINITGKTGGPYNIRATVKPANNQSVPMALPKKASSVDQDKKPSDDVRDRRRDDYLTRLLGGEPSGDVPAIDPLTGALVNTALDNKEAAQDRANQQASKPPTTSSPSPSPSTSPSPMSGMGPEDHHHGTSGASGPEDHHHGLPTDGSPGSTDVTQRAIETFYDGLPADITNRLAVMGMDPMATVHAAGDPYVPYAMAMNKADFNTMRNIANSDAISDFNQRIAMLGMAGATALRNLNDPNKGFAARDTLRKVAEDLHYAGQGLDENKANEAKLKAICGDISKIWSNLSQQNQNK